MSVYFHLAYAGVLNTRSGSRWVSRYFVLHRGHWFWFETKTCYEVGGLENCVGSVSLLINEFSIDLDPKYVTRFSLTLRDWGCVIIDTGVQERDRGAWVLHFLAYKNKVSFLSFFSTTVTRKERGENDGMMWRDTGRVNA